MQSKGNYYQQEPRYSKYNEAVSQILRIGNLWDSCHYFRKKLSLFNWNINLDCIWMELSADATEKDIENIEKYNSNILKNQQKRDYLYQLLIKKEMFLRKLQNRQGKGAAYADPDEDDM